MTINLRALLVGYSAGSIWWHRARADSHQDERLLTYLEHPLRRAKLVSGDLDPRAFEASVQGQFHLPKRVGCVGACPSSCLLSPEDPGGLWGSLSQRGTNPTAKLNV